MQISKKSNQVTKRDLESVLSKETGNNERSKTEHVIGQEILDSEINAQEHEKEIYEKIDIDMPEEGHSKHEKFDYTFSDRLKKPEKESATYSTEIYNYYKKLGNITLIEAVEISGKAAKLVKKRNELFDQQDDIWSKEDSVSKESINLLKNIKKERDGLELEIKNYDKESNKLIAESRMIAIERQIRFADYADSFTDLGREEINRILISSSKNVKIGEYVDYFFELKDKANNAEKTAKELIYRLENVILECDNYKIEISDLNGRVDSLNSNLDKKVDKIKKEFDDKKNRLIRTNNEKTEKMNEKTANYESNESKLKKELKGAKNKLRKSAFSKFGYVIAGSFIVAALTVPLIFGAYLINPKTSKNLENKLEKVIKITSEEKGILIDKNNELEGVIKKLNAELKKQDAVYTQFKIAMGDKLDASKEYTPEQMVNLTKTALDNLITLKNGISTAELNSFRPKIKLAKTMLNSDKENTNYKQYSIYIYDKWEKIFMSLSSSTSNLIKNSKERINVLKADNLNYVIESIFHTYKFRQNTLNNLKKQRKLINWMNDLAYVMGGEYKGRFDDIIKIHNKSAFSNIKTYQDFGGSLNELISKEDDKTVLLDAYTSLSLVDQRTTRGKFIGKGYGILNKGIKDLQKKLEDKGVDISNIYQIFVNLGDGKGAHPKR